MMNYWSDIQIDNHRFALSSLISTRILHEVINSGLYIGATVPANPEKDGMHLGLKESKIVSLDNKYWQLIIFHDNDEIKASRAL